MAQPVRLENKEVFKELLRSYKISSHAQKILDESRLVVVSGLAGGGRNTVINELVRKHDYFFIVSDTTRPPKLRNGVMEQDGVHYYFRTEQDMLRDLQNGEFLEAEIIHNQQVSGTSIRELSRANQSGRIAIHDFEYGGAHNVAVAKPDAVIIGLLPPSYDEWLRRLKSREDMHDQEFRNRLETAEKVLVNMLGQPYFKFVINDTIEQCVDDIRKIVEDGTYNEASRRTSHQIAEDILQQVRASLQP